jgi:hypothetical protein
LQWFEQFGKIVLTLRLIRPIASKEEAYMRKYAAALILCVIFIGGLVSLTGLWVGADKWQRAAEREDYTLLEVTEVSATWPDAVLNEARDAMVRVSRVKDSQNTRMPIPASAPTPPPTPAPAPAPTPKATNTIRLSALSLDTNGAAAIIGKGPVGAFYHVLVNGEAVGGTRGDAAGAFAVRLSPPSQSSGVAQPRRVQLRAFDDGGELLASSAPLTFSAPTAPTAPAVIRRAATDSPRLPETSLIDKAIEPLSIEAIGYNTSGAPIIAGRGQPGAIAQLYLDGVLSAKTTIDRSGTWRAALPDVVDPAVYRLRVDQLDINGAVSSRAETPFERARSSELLLEDGLFVVQPGNNLWRIARQIYGDGHLYQRIYLYNKAQIKDPNLIYPGQVLTLPDSTTQEQQLAAR